jgi:hypothetical protein
MSRQDSWRWRVLHAMTISALVLAVGLPISQAQQRRGGGRNARQGDAANAASMANGVNDAAVVATMKKGIEFLLAQKKGDNWESGTHFTGFSPETGGETALVLYALLHAGESLQDDPELGPTLKWNSKELAPAVAWLSRNEPDGTYAAGLQACALALTRKKKDEKLTEGPRLGLEVAKKYLFEAMGADGGYEYVIPKDKRTSKSGSTANFSPIGDLSNAQYGTLGVWALSDYGIEIPDKYWKVSDRFWRLTQEASGSWPYRPGEGRDRPSMGVAGLASLYITSENLDGEVRLTPRPDKNIDSGVAWLSKDFIADTSDYYYLYGVERVGLASGLKFLGTANWYKQGAASIIKRQGGDGSWGDGSFHRGDVKTVSTAYCLLFLARGRNPVVFNKLEYAGPWNARPRDNANLTNWMSKKFEKPINWQVVNLQVSPDEWLDAPILLITGSVDPKFTPEDIAKIRAYIEAGGIVFSTADGGRAEFTEAIRKYASQVVENKYEMRKLPPTHSIFSKELWGEVKNPPLMMGMSNGVRDIWIHSNIDLGASWQGRRDAQFDQFAIPANLFFYATGKGTLRSKLAPLTVATGDAKPVRTIALARVDHVANADPEPGAWKRMAKLAQAEFKTELKLSTVKWGQLDPKANKIAHMTGSTRFTLNDADAGALKGYLDNGGLLLADAAGGSADFTESFLALMQGLYPGNALAPLAGDHPIFKGAMADGEPIGEVEFRKYGNLKLGHRVTAPRLDALTINGRIAVIFSPYDMTSGFLGTSTWGIIGYAPETAQALARNILLFSEDQKAVVAAAPDPKAAVAK